MTTTDEVLEQARQRTGLDELDSDSWRPGMELVLELTRDPRMSEGGVDMVLGRCVDALSNRLRVAEWVRTHPEVRDEVVEKPLFILGMPRTGTTVASYLLDRDPERRSLLKWEAVHTAPPATPETWRSDPRCLAMLEEDRAILAMVSELGVGIPHWEDADGPTECMFVHEQDFKGLLWDSFTPGTAYAEWLLGECDVTSAYEYQKVVLQVLQSGVPGRWSLKMPSHSVHLDALLSVFPDAELVWAHRDPFRATASLCNLLMLPATMTLTADSIDKAALGQNAKAQMREHVARPMAVRDRIGDDRFFDLHYSELMDDPIDTMRRLYEWSGGSLSDSTASAMAGWLEENPQHKLGRSEYTLGEYGLSTDELAPVFGDYLERFGIELEGEA